MICKTKLLSVRFGFTLNQHNHGDSRAKIHFVDDNDKPFCNPKMKMQPEMYEHDIKWLMFGDIFPCDICLTCLRSRIRMEYQIE
jgi:hypothetical protein